MTAFATQLDDPSRFLFNDGEFRLPPGWEDRSVIALAYPAGAAKAEASFAVTRNPLVTSHSSLSLYVDKQLVDLAKTCPKFELLNREQVDVNGSGGERLEFKWRSPDGALIRQQQTILVSKNGTALTFTGTAPEPKFAEHSPAFEAIIQSLRLRA